MPQKPKPPFWLVMIVGVLLMIFASNISTFSRLLAPYIGGYMEHVRTEVTKAGRSKKSQSPPEHTNREADEPSQPDDD